MKRILCPAIFILFAANSTALAIPTAPTLKPSANIYSKIVEPQTYKLLSDALDAADSGNWDLVRSVYKSSQDESVKDLLLWKLTTNASAQPTFSELKFALSSLNDWPKRIEMQKQAENLLKGLSLRDSELSAWFDEYPAVTGGGKLQYAQLLERQNKSPIALATIKDIWWNHALSSTDQRELLLQFAKDLNAIDHAKRVDMLLWNNQRSDAKSLFSRLNSADRELAEARVGLMEGRRGVDSLIEDVPSKKQSDPGLLYERARWRRKRANNRDGAIEVLLDIDPFKTSETGRRRIWSERSYLLRDLIKERRWDEAYKMAANHGLSEGVSFADAEFYAGWVALRYLNKPAIAFKHFDTLTKGVSSPISHARGLYWRGESLTAMNSSEDSTDAASKIESLKPAIDTNESEPKTPITISEAARESYELAAHYNFTFYGQMAAERLKAMGLSDAQLDFALPDLATEEETQSFHSRNVVKAAIMLADSGRLNSFERFSYHLDDLLKTPQEHQLLSDLAVHYLEPRAGVRGGKAALAKDLVAPNAAFPIIELPESARSGIAEPALVMALSRQESELSPQAVSHANARGMMQLLPSTGRLTARQVGLPYRESWLTDDPTYNLKVGRSFLDDLIEDFDGSYILALAAYNAGPSRPKRWIEEYGDPRKGEIDPIDFIESIPFSETRNYVQRILENVQVYRHRLSGDPTDIKLIEDLSRGGVPQ
ncbi:lytic transglycosylase domain-containing protein [Hirschia litorea]|uniref:Lytic transglycosylase domain-containing protein n=1 Tax=Hirschia litorea TaxID=1199156 RepID=A0ABW2IHN8_9PROT